VLVVSPNERALQATRTLWNLRQFDLARRNRGTRAVRDFWRQCRSPAWRPVRYGLIALAAVQLVGLNAWAWHQSAQVAQKRLAMVSLLQTTFPQVRAVLDAPLQMQREVDSLRTLAGKPSDADLEPLLQAAMSAWPISQPPVESLKFEPGRLTLAASGWSADELEQFRSQLRPAGWQVDAAEGRLNLSRSAARVSP
jgi:general secretion pathway protein L